MSKSKPVKARKVNITVRIDEDLSEEFKNLVRDCAGKPLYLTQSSFLESAIRAQIKHVKKEADLGE